MVDADRLTDLLARVTERVLVLDEYADVDRESVLRDRRSMNDVKYTFQTAIEACIDAGQHAVAAIGLGRPATNAAVFRLLADHGTLPDDLADRLGRAVGFRNVLVHGYAEVDDRLVLEQLDDRGDLTAFVAGMTRLLPD